MLHLRKMTMEDYDAVYALWKDTPGVGLNDWDDAEEGIAFYLARNPNTCFVALDAGAVMGAVLAGHDGRRGFIYHLAVAEAARRKGIGSGLVAQAVYALGLENIRKVALVVMADNDDGNAFWQGQGFDARGDLVYRNRMVEREGCCGGH